MIHKRLNRDKWGFQYYPYYQMRIDDELFHGMVCLIRLTDGEKNFWEMQKAGRIQVTGEGMTWLELIPDDTHRVITAIYFPDGTHDPERKHYPVTADERYQPSIWYIDITEGMGYEEDGIAVFIDKYLDVIITPEGDVKVDDRDELDAAYVSGDLTKEQHDAALAEGEAILRAYSDDIRGLDAWCAAVRQLAEERITAGEPITMCREVRENEKSRKVAESFGFVYDRSEEITRPWDGAVKTIDSCLLTRESFLVRRQTDKKRELFLSQKHTLDLFLERGAISQAQYDKSLGDLIRKMGMLSGTHPM